MEELSIPDDLDATLRGDAEVDDDKLAEEPEPSPLPTVEAAVKKGRPSARRVAPSLSPRRTRARSRSLSVDQPDDVLVASRTTRSKSKALAAAAAAALEPVSESQVSDEFVAHSDDDEFEMYEVEDNLKISVQSRGASLSQNWLYFVLLLLARVLTRAAYTLQDRLRRIRCIIVILPRTCSPPDVCIQSPTMPY